MKTRDRQLAVLAACDKAEARNKAQHTPGPWSYNEMATVVAGDVEDAAATCVASLRHRDFGEKNVHSIEEVMANGRLIAAAPDLLEACKAWEHARREGGISMVDWFNVAWEKTQAAIQKAEAGQ